jgi:perosamine synthetase
MIKAHEPILNMQPMFTEADAKAVANQVRIGFVGPGQATRDYADALAAFTGRRYCELTVSGTMALTAAAIAIGLKPGDEILVPAYGVISTINSFASYQFTPRLVDIDMQRCVITVDELDRRVTPATRAVCYVNFSGATGKDLVAIEAYCKANHLLLIEDAACAVGQCHEGRPAGSFGDVSCYSFSAPKILTTGQGGATLTNSAEVRDNLIRFTDQGDIDWRKTNLSHGIGNNLRCNDILAALGMAQLDTLGNRLARRRASYSVFKDKLPDHIYRIPGKEAPLHNIVLAENPDRLIAHLLECDIRAIRQYRTLSEHPPYRQLADITYPHSDLWTRHAVYLPFGTGLTVEQAERVACAVQTSGVPLMPFR